MTASRFRELATALQGATEGAHMGHADFRVNGRVFASLDRTERVGSMKLPASEQARFIAAAPTAVEPASGAWGLQGWTRIQLEEVGEELLGEALTLAWQDAAARTSSPRRALTREADPTPTRVSRASTPPRRTAATPAIVTRTRKRAAPGKPPSTAVSGSRTGRRSASAKPASTTARVRAGAAAARRSSGTGSADVDAYMAACAPAVRAILERIRQIVRKAAPAAEEVISYRMPAFTLDGALLYYAPFKAHIGLFPPIKGDTALNRSLARYRGPKGNLRFPLDEPMPYPLIRRLVQQRIAEHLSRRVARRARR